MERRINQFEQSLENIDKAIKSRKPVERCDRDTIGWAAMTSKWNGPGYVEQSQIEGRITGSPTDINELKQKGAVRLVATGMNRGFEKDES